MLVAFTCVLTVQIDMTYEYLLKTRIKIFNIRVHVERILNVLKIWFKLFLTKNAITKQIGK